MDCDCSRAVSALNPNLTQNDESVSSATFKGKAHCFGWGLHSDLFSTHIGEAAASLFDRLRWWRVEEQNAHRSRLGFCLSRLANIRNAWKADDRGCPLDDCWWPSKEGLVLALEVRRRTIDQPPASCPLLTPVQTFVRLVFNIASFRRRLGCSGSEIIAPTRI